MQLWPISVVALSIVTVLCLVGTLAHSYKDNLAQRIGMALLAYGCASRVQHIMGSQYVSPDWLVVHVGIAVYAMGTAFKHWRLIRRARCAELTELAERDYIHVVGGKGGA